MQPQRALPMPRQLGTAPTRLQASSSGGSNPGGPGPVVEGQSWGNLLHCHEPSQAPSQQLGRRVSALQVTTSLNTSGSSRASHRKLGVTRSSEVDVAYVIAWEWAWAEMVHERAAWVALTLTPGQPPLMHTWP